LLRKVIPEEHDSSESAVQSAPVIKANTTLLAVKEEYGTLGWTRLIPPVGSG